MLANNRYFVMITFNHCARRTRRCEVLSLLWSQVLPCSVLSYTAKIRGNEFTWQVSARVAELSLKQGMFDMNVPRVQRKNAPITRQSMTLQDLLYLFFSIVNYLKIKTNSNFDFDCAQSAEIGLPVIRQPEIMFYRASIVAHLTCCVYIYSCTANVWPLKQASVTNCNS